MAITLKRKNQESGLRPLKPSQDLQGVANLIEEAFALELDRASRVALREMHRMGRWGPLLGWLDFINPDVNTNLNGFVWLEDGRIVGNITVSRNGPGSRHWFISNVAVARGYRNRGIARTLMTAAIEFVQEMYGQQVSLQVRLGNEPAIKLYKSFGFKHISATSYLYLSRNQAIPHSPLPDGFKLRSHQFNLADAESTYALARSAVSPNLQIERPLRQSQYRYNRSEIQFYNFWRRLVGLGENKYFVVEQLDSKGKFAAILDILSASWRGSHQISLMVHPDWWGMLENPLISLGLAYLSAYPSHPIAFQHSNEHQTGIDAFTKFGFQIQRTHIWMKLSL